jgi:hypothetical protein
MKEKSPEERVNTRDIPKDPPELSPEEEVPSQGSRQGGVSDQGKDLRHGLPRRGKDIPLE